jgi:lipopolysaccharide transport system ATP-binding protein
MKDVSVNDGRTVLFVSHNMSAVKSLCNKGLVMKNGQVSLQGSIDESISEYYRVLSSSINKEESLRIYNSAYLELNDVFIKDYFEQPDAIRFDQPLIIVMRGKVKKHTKNVSFAVCITNFDNVAVSTIRSIDKDAVVDLDGEFEVEVVINHNIRAGNYVVSVGVDSQSENIYFNPALFQLSVLEVGNREYKYKNYGVVDFEADWKIAV